jgi:hypothetical protein
METSGQHDWGHLPSLTHKTFHDIKKMCGQGMQGLLAWPKTTLAAGSHLKRKERMNNTVVFPSQIHQLLQNPKAVQGHANCTCKMVVDYLGDKLQLLTYIK